jgi:hypothetical protein
MAPLMPGSLLGPLPRVVAPLARDAARIARLHDPRNLYSYCFCGIE